MCVQAQGWILAKNALDWIFWSPDARWFKTGQDDATQSSKLEPLVPAPNICPTNIQMLYSAWAFSQDYGLESMLTQSISGKPSNRNSPSHSVQYLLALLPTGATARLFIASPQDSLDPSRQSLDPLTLHSACLVSRRLCQVAEAILYHESVPRHGVSIQPLQKWIRRLSDFVRTVVKRPDLGALVRDSSYVSRCF